MKISREKLRDRGWSEADIEKTMKIINNAEKNKDQKLKIFEKFIYWIALLIAIIGNFIFSFVMMPIIIIVNNMNIYFIVIVLSVSFGVMFTAIVRDMDLHIKHDVIVIFIVPVIAFINFFIITNLANEISLQNKIQSYHAPGLVSLIYTVFFLAPYLIFLASKGLKRKYYKSMAQLT
jgi:hypothetical protein